MKKENPLESFLNKEMIYSIIELTALQSRVYKEFCKVFDKEEARIQTQIYMNSMSYGAGEKENK